MEGSKIQYIVIKKSNINNILYANNDSENRILEELRYYPQDLLQFLPGFDYFNYVKTQNNSGIQVLRFNSPNLISETNTLNTLLDYLVLKNRICVFLISKECLQELSIIINKVVEKSIKIFYYKIYSYKQKIEINNDPRNFIDHQHFYQILNRDSKILSKHIMSFFKKLKGVKLHVSQNINKNVEFFNFKPIVSNVININTINNIYNLEHHTNWEKAPLEGRKELLLQSLKLLDDIHIEWSKRKQMKQTFFPTLILVFPYNNPIISNFIKEHSKDRHFTKAILAEQDSNFLFNIQGIEDSVDLDDYARLVNFLNETKLDNLDGISYLHSTFQFSPILRFPILSSKINSLISMFGLGQKNGILNSQKRHKAILKLGRRLNSIYLDRSMEDYLSKRNGQILAISDLPIEWMLIKNTPLGFLCDVCRIQDSNIPGLINNYSAFSKTTVILGSKSIKNTLIVFSSNENDKTDFSNSYKSAKAFQEKLGFNIEFASDAINIKFLLEKYKPEILIFDCHCKFDRSSMSSYLQIGDQNIYPRDIVENNIAAPIVYLASCNTNPNYDNVTKLHDAFFEAGARSVTGTFLPIDMDKGTFIYLRMLNLLNSKNERLVSGNWLHFISFCIRTSVIWEARFKCYKNLGRELTQDEENEFVNLLEKLHRFEDRCNVFNLLINEGIKLSEDLILQISDTNMGFMYYTHYGRPDLIMFKD